MTISHMKMEQHLWPVHGTSPHPRGSRTIAENRPTENFPPAEPEIPQTSIYMRRFPKSRGTAVPQNNIQVIRQ